MGEKDSARGAAGIPEPWFAVHPRLALSVAGLSMAAVFVLRLAVAGAEDSIAMLYVLPIALVAFAFGLRRGHAAGAGCWQVGGGADHGHAVGPWRQVFQHEVNDSVIQGLVATKWLLESGEVERAIALLEATTVTAQELVTRVLGSESVLPSDVRRPLLVRRLRPAPPL